MHVAGGWWLQKRSNINIFTTRAYYGLQFSDGYAAKYMVHCEPESRLKYL